MMSYRYIVYTVVSATALASCRKPYTPAVINAPHSYLVVEGTINNGHDSTIIKLSHTVNLSGNVKTNPELYATITIEGDDNIVYTVFNLGNGKYGLPGITLDEARKYRLRIQTEDHGDYLSDYVPVVKAPPVDSLYYRVKDEGVELYLDTHDPSKKSRYYRWEYDETWVYTSLYQSLFKSNGDTVPHRDPVHEQIYTCWRTESSSTILLGTSVKLSQDVISDAPIGFVSRHSDKIRHKYSMLVKQFALTEGAYKFWVNLKKTTEQLGSIFDAQPSQIKGNIYSVADPNEPVIGYVSIGSYSTKRTFVDQRKLPAWLDPIPPNEGCPVHGYFYSATDPVSGGSINEVDEHINYNKTLFPPEIPIDGIYLRGFPYPIGFNASYPECVDCTLRGTNIQPDFWQ